MTTFNPGVLSAYTTAAQSMQQDIALPFKLQAAELQNRAAQAKMERDRQIQEIMGKDAGISLEERIRNLINIGATNEAKVLQGILESQREAQEPLSGPGKVQRDIKRGLVPPDTPLRGEGVKVEVGKGETEYQKARGKAVAEKVGKVMTAANNASTNLKLLDQAENEILTGTATGGPTAFIKAYIGEAASGLEIMDMLPKGFAEETASLETIRAGANMMLTQNIKKMGAKPTDRDAQVIRETLQGIGLSKLGNLRVIDLNRQIEHRALRQAEIVQNLENRNASSREINKALYEDSRNNPLVFTPTEELQKKLEGAPTRLSLGADEAGIQRLRDKGYSDAQIQEFLRGR